jgi:MFS transporter, DHA2 family, multidrug resistance protein
MAFATMAPGMRNEATALFSSIRNIGNSIGISVAQALLVRNMQVLCASLAAHVTPFSHLLPRLDAGSGVRARELLNSQVSAQASMIAYIDVCKFLLILTLVAGLVLCFVRGASKAGTAGTVTAVE